MPKTLSFRAPLSLLLRSQFCSAGSSSSRSTALLARNFAFRPTRPVMEKNTHRNGIDADNLKPAGRYNTRFRALLSEEASGGWEKCWEMGLTPWDLGGPTPIILHLLQNGSLPKGRALIPGCGTGYDVVEMASPERYVVGLDISKTVTNKATKMFSSSPNKEYFSFLSEDFFTWLPTEPFDLIFDYTFFCAIEPRMRPLWAKGMHELLKQDGELITLIFPIDDHDGGPPFRVTVSDYEDVLLPLGFSAISIEDNQHSVRPRKGMEKLGRWKKRSLVRSVL